MNNIKTLHPNYMSSFQCIGSECKNSCCSQWNIHVDKDTYKKYKNSNNPLFKNKCKELFYKKESNVCIKLDKDGNCPFLDDENLCSIHKNLGHNYLSHVCKTYPRLYRSIDNIYEIDLSLSCEAAAKIILENKEGIHFKNEYIETPSALKNLEIDKENLIGKYFWPLRTLFIDILQYRVITLNERLLLMTTIINILKEIKTEQEIESLIYNIQNSLDNQEYIDVMNNQQEDKESLFEKQVYIVSLIKKKILSSKVSGDNQNKPVDKLHLNYKLYKETYHTKYLDFINKNEHILENYLVSLFFSKNPTFSTIQELEEKYIKLIGSLALFKFTITSFLQDNDSITFEETYRIVSRLARYTNHGERVSNIIYEVFKENNNNPLLDTISIISI